jgi:hypothetical protein
MSRSTSSDRPSRRGWLKGAAAGLVPLSLGGVLAPAMPGRPVRVRVRLDGQPPGPDHGWDVGADGLVLVDRPRMHQLVRQAGSVDDRTFELQTLDPGLRAYIFAFG